MANSVISKSRQSWKLMAGFAVTCGGGLALTYGLRDPGIPAVAIGGLLLALLSMVTTWFSIRCHQCGARWLWMALSTQRSLQWWDWLEAQKVCPKCGNDPGVHHASIRRSA
jgi:hypothetical protein